MGKLEGGRAPLFVLTSSDKGMGRPSGEDEGGDPAENQRERACSGQRSSGGKVIREGFRQIERGGERKIAMGGWEGTSPNGFGPRITGAESSLYEKGPLDLGGRQSYLARKG